MDPTVLNGANAVFLAQMHAIWAANPTLVDPGWAAFFSELADDAPNVTKELQGASWHPSDAKVVGAADPDAKPATPAKGKDGKGAGGGASPEQVRAATLDSIRALMLIRSYRVRGHLKADLDPLKLVEPGAHPELDWRTYGFTEADLDRPIFLDYVLGLETATLSQIMQVLNETYCGSIGVEFMHIQDPDQKAWIQKRIESIRNQTQFTEAGKRAILERLTEAEGFEKFLQVKYTGTKRFGLEGGETVIPAIEQIIKRGSQMGLKEIIFGMAHRGRLNVLANILHKPYRTIFSEFQGNPSHTENVQGSGDVKYHLGTSADRDFDGQTVHLSLTPNPSHLEIVDPVVLGKVRAKQDQRGDTERSQVMAVLMHGDAAFAGQGVVAECFALSQLTGYKTGGTIHIIINNQIGFTTSPRFSRSSPYCTDVAKMVQAPIFHVNGDDPEAVVHVARIATEFRQTFKADVVLDMVCYRRQGHNEADEPAFTQPQMYKKIARHPTTRTVFSDKLIGEGVIDQAGSKAVQDKFMALLEEEYQAAQGFKANKDDWLEGKWQGLAQLHDEEEFRDEPTAVALERLKEVGAKLCQVPEGFDANKKILRQLEAKKQAVDSGQGIDWATAEALAFGTLLREKTPVRLSGQDCGRGTFSQRHAVLTDQTTEKRFAPLSNLSSDQARFEVIDSPLSEASVLGFDYGYSTTEPHALVLWEAQFGDFANGAQVVVDQFISSGETKWLRMSGLVMMLPHGLEGQGPEHSSARLERYLQMCAEDNIQVLNCSTPANFFHALRRQVRRNFRKPLIVMTPKSLLRHKACISPLSDFGPGSRFWRLLAEKEELVADKAVKRVILCSGKIYYDLLEERTKRGLKDAAILRVEQLYPWPKDHLLKEIERYANAEVIWCQEEPANMGAWMFVLPRLHYALDELGRKQRPHYAGRVAAASPATGWHKQHVQEQAEILDQALAWKFEALPQPFKRATPLSSITAKR
ncbi:MAG: 2-oxoglutarate dehydrogenase E1 component [Alphaproteobacteria bacterium]|nr:2-oxoglutarate dehydrogenase E1 component [Alphaproteobacteria bacterium]